MKTRCFFRCTLAPVTSLLAFFTVGSLPADILYWDTNGATTGSANSTTTIWGVNDSWTLDPNGETATTAYTSGSDVVISAGTNATGTSTLKINGNQSANSLTLQEGTLTISATNTAGTVTNNAGSLTLGAGGLTMADGLNGDVTIGTSMGNLVLSSSQTWTNSTVTTARKLSVLAGVVGNATTGNTTTLTSSGVTSGSTIPPTNVSEIQGIIGNGSGGGELAITKTGGGTLTLSGTAANTYTGLTTVSGGTLSLGKTAGINAVAGNINVTGGTLYFANSNQIADTATISGSSGTININNKSETFASLALTGSAKFSTGTGNVTVSGAATANLANSGISLITVNSGGLMTMNSLTLSGANNALNGTAGGNVLIGGSSTSAVTTMTIGSGGLSMSGQTIQVNVATGVNLGTKINLGGDFTGSGTNTIAVSGTTLLPADLALGSGTRSFNVTNGTTTIGLKTSGENILKTGTGTLSFTSANSFTGTVAVDAGSLILANSNAYTGLTTIAAGATLSARHNTALGTTGAGTTVAAGGSLLLQGDITVTGEALFLTGTSSSSSSANIIHGLNNISGNNEWAGTIDLNLTPNNGRIYTTAGNLKISGGVTLSSTTAGTGTGSYLVLGGTAGDGLISGNISMGAGTTQKLGIIKNTTDTWILSGTNTYTGQTLIYDGTISASSIATNLGTDTSAIGLGDSANTGKLLYTGSGETTARGINLRATNTGVTTGGGTIEQAGSGLLKINGNVTSVASSSGKNLTLTGSTSGTGEIAGNISNGTGTGADTSLVKSGTGTWTISGASNTYSGSTNVTGGQLIAKTAINSTSGLGITAGTFTLGASNIVNDAAAVSLATGATLQMAGFSESLAALTVTGADAILDLSGGDSILSFADSTSSDWTGGLLTITGWSGLLAGGGSEQVLFSSAGLTTGQIGQISFLNPTGLAAGTYSSKFIGNELVPNIVPEPSTLLLTALGSLALLRRKR